MLKQFASVIDRLNSKWPGWNPFHLRFCNVSGREQHSENIFGRQGLAHVQNVGPKRKRLGTGQPIFFDIVQIGGRANCPGPEKSAINADQVAVNGTAGVPVPVVLKQRGGVGVVNVHDAFDKALELPDSDLDVMLVDDIAEIGGNGGLNAPRRLDGIHQIGKIPLAMDRLLFVEVDVPVEHSAIEYHLVIHINDNLGFQFVNGVIQRMPWKNGEVQGAGHADLQTARRRENQPVLRLDARIEEVSVRENIEHYKLPPR